MSCGACDSPAFGSGGANGIPVTIPASEIDPGVLIANARLVDRDRDAKGAVFVRHGKIAAVYEGDEAERARAEIEGLSSGADCGEPFYPGPPEVIDARGATLMPAFVDMHAHFRDPGFTHKEDAESASRAASAGGYGTVVLMANVDPVVSDQGAAEAVNARVRSLGLVDSFQAVSLTRGFDGRDTRALDALDPRAVPVATEDGREVASAAVMLEAMRRCAARGVIVSCHCEDPELASAAKPFRAEALAAAKAAGLPDGTLRDGSGAAPDSVSSALAEAGRLLRLAEDLMTARNLSLAAEAGCRVHVAHVSTKGSIEAVRAAKAAMRSRGAAKAESGAAGTPGAVTCEVTPHHLALTDSVPEIVNPPLRGEEDRAAILEALLDGTIDAIATDHAPHTATDKAAGAPGFSGIQIAFATCHTTLVKTGHLSLSALSALMSANPAAILGLKRGLLVPGYAADLVLVDPSGEFTVNPDSREETSESPLWYSKGKNTPFAGKRLCGRVLATFTAGRMAYRGYFPGF